MVPFKRYEGAMQEDGPQMPNTVLDAKVSNLCISELLGRLERFTEKDSMDGPAAYPWADRFVMGYPLPHWQRPLVWSEAQCVQFIVSIWSGVDLGSYLVNGLWDYQLNGDKEEFRKFSEVLLDGQQRLTAIERYVTDQIAVPDANGTLRYWSELGRQERRRFGTFHFAKGTIESWDENKLRLAYDLRAFGGTPHTEDQRATPRVKL